MKKGHLKKGVLKCVSVDGVTTYQVEFTLDHCPSHGQNDHTPEAQRRKSLAGRTSSTGRALSSRAASTAKQILGDEYFLIDKILKSRIRKEQREYLVQWQGYGHKYNSWEPAAHSEKCHEMLRQFHERNGLPITPSM